MTRNRCSDHLRQKAARPTGGDTDAENVLSEDTMAEVMEREYNVTVIFADRDAARYHFIFWADRNAPLSETVSLLNQIGTVRVLTDVRNRRVIVRKR